MQRLGASVTETVSILGSSPRTGLDDVAGLLEDDITGLTNGVRPLGRTGFASHLADEIADPRHPAHARVWLRIDGELPGDERIHHAALAYASDLTLLSATTVPHGVLIGLDVQAASIDHAMWFHRPFRADDWLLHDQVSPSASYGLGLATGRLFQNGVLVANVAQEGLIRPPHNL